MRAAIYTRVSTDEQAKDGKESLTGQRDSQLAIAECMGAEVFKVYTAAGERTRKNRDGRQSNGLVV